MTSRLPAVWAIRQPRYQDDVALEMESAERSISASPFPTSLTIVPQAPKRQEPTKRDR
jgi:hypothetical protein